MYFLKKIILILMLVNSYALTDSYTFDRGSFEKYEKKINKTFDTIDNGVKRSVYDILGANDSPKAKLLIKWFKIASQVTHNNSLSFFIKNTNYKVSAIKEQLFLENDSITEKEQRLFYDKFRFLSNFSKKNFRPLNQNLYANTDVNFRTMPIVFSLTKKKYDEKKPVVIKQNTLLNLLYKISYTINGEDALWGYVEFKEEDRKGWINLKHTRKIR